jgi:hypothetical protein
LKSIHGEGIIHNDLTPRNIIMSADGPKIIDFGNVMVERDGTGNSSGISPDKVWGTAGYVSPEQLDGGPATRNSDIYALGAVLYFATTRKLPMSDGEPDLREVPLALKPTVRDCLQKQPNRRPSPHQVVENLTYVKGEFLQSEEWGQNHRYSEPGVTKEQMIFQEEPKANRLNKFADSLLTQGFRASSWVRNFRPSLPEIDFRAFLRPVKTAGVSVWHAPAAIRVLIAALVISAVPGYSLLHWVHGWDGVLLVTALIAAVTIILAAEVAETTHDTDDVPTVAFGLGVLGWFLCGLCAFILTLVSLETTWWKRILIGVGISLLVGLLLGVASVTASVAGGGTGSPAIGVGWGMLIAVVATALLYWGAAAGLGVSIGLGSIALLGVSVSVTLLLHPAD